MIGIKIRNAFLETVASTAISFELVSSIFLGDSESFIPGSYSFPFDLPLSDHNRITLGLPEIIGNATPLLSKEPCEVYFNNVRLPLDGLASISEVSGGNIKFYITIQALEPLKDVKLGDINLGGVRDLSFLNLPDRLAQAKSIAVNPLTSDFAYFPVQNLGFWEGNDLAPSHASKNVQNYWHTDTEEFVSDPTQGTVTPFVRFDYLLRRIFEHQGLSFTNSFQTTDELRLLYLYNNWNTFTNGEWPKSIDLKNHVTADMKATDLLRYVQRTFCLGISKEPFDPNYELVKLDDLLRQAPAHDWTDRLLADPVKTQTTNIIGKFVQKSTGTDVGDTIDLPPFTVVSTVDTYYDAIPITALGYHYIRALDCYYLVTPDYTALYFPLTQHVEDATNDTALELDLGGTNTTQASMVDLDGEVHGVTASFVYIKGSSPASKTNYPPLLLFYRGLYPIHGTGKLLPLASRAPYDMDGNVIGDYSLAWDTQFGIFNRFWKNWAGFLSRRTEVTARLQLTLPDILNFRFRQIVRIQNMNYFVKSLRVNFTQKGLEPVEAKLVSII